MTYIVTINFGDDAKPSEKILNSEEEVGFYLEEIPNMLGFLDSDSMNINIKAVLHPELVGHPPLF